MALWKCKFNTQLRAFPLFHDPFLLLANGSLHDDFLFVNGTHCACPVQANLLSTQGTKQLQSQKIKKTWTTYASPRLL